MIRERSRQVRSRLFLRGVRWQVPSVQRRGCQPAVPHQPRPLPVLVCQRPLILNRLTFQNQVQLSKTRNHSWITTCYPGRGPSISLLTKYGLARMSTGTSPRVTTFRVTNSVLAKSRITTSWRGSQSMFPILSPSTNWAPMHSGTRMMMVIRKTTVICI